MQKYILAGAMLMLNFLGKAQSTLAPLTVEKIMRNPMWMGSSPSILQWSLGGDSLFFRWNPEGKPADSLYFITLKNKMPQKASNEMMQNMIRPQTVVYNQTRNQMVYEKNGDIFFTDFKTKKQKQITQTMDFETNPQFCFQEKKIVYQKANNFFAWDIASGETWQLTNIGTGSPGLGTRPVENRRTSAEGKEELWLRQDQLANFDVLRERKAKADTSAAYRNALPKEKRLRNIVISEGSIRGMGISPDGRFVNYRVMKPATNKNTLVPDYVTESGYTTDIPGRDKVGAASPVSEFYIFDRERDTVFSLQTDSIPGIRDLPDYLKDYPKTLEKRKKANEKRAIMVQSVSWSPNGSHAVVEIFSDDNKDRWLLLWDMKSNKLKLLDRQREEAWVGGPGIGFGSNSGWIDEDNFWFQSEVTGYSHLYAINVKTFSKRTFTSGNYEVQTVSLSQDKKQFFITTNEVHPGEKHFYILNIASGKKQKITAMTGANNAEASPNGKYIAFLHSYSNQPWELFIQENKHGTEAQQITFKAQSAEFRSYPWRDPKVVVFTAADGAQVYARIYTPEKPHANKPAVLFVHGAGYLQNAHKWWSSYFREYMFHNLLADQGYVVMDIDYRGSAGYGRDWRTGIYRHMGGKDLSDHVDAVKYLVKNYGVDPKHVGLYGGSYGGFISLMAMFNEPDVFAAGAALRPVTDWANYNHGYTSNILNEPYNDSIAYYRSSPIYFAKGLKGSLLICHGVVDVNVHYQDAVKLSQRLIELGKNNWELTGYPMEDHGFVEPSSWTDEYKRIFKLFEMVLKK